MLFVTGYSSAPSVTTRSTARSLTTASEVSSVSNWLSESVHSKGQVAELGDVKTGPMSRQDLYAVGRTFKEMVSKKLFLKIKKTYCSHLHCCPFQPFNGILIKMRLF